MQNIGKIISYQTYQTLEKLGITAGNVCYEAGFPGFRSATEFEVKTNLKWLETKISLAVLQRKLRKYTSHCLCVTVLKWLAA